MFLLERLSPTERAVFLLHDIFDCGYADIARIVGKTEMALRQMVSRIRKRLRTDKPRFEPDKKERETLIKKFAVASNTGDEKTLLSLFADDISGSFGRWRQGNCGTKNHLRQRSSGTSFFNHEFKIR